MDLWFLQERQVGMIFAIRSELWQHFTGGHQDEKENPMD